MEQRRRLLERCVNLCDPHLVSVPFLQCLHFFLRYLLFLSLHRLYSTLLSQLSFVFCLYIFFFNGSYSLNTGMLRTVTSPLRSLAHPRLTCRLRSNKKSPLFDSRLNRPAHPLMRHYCRSLRSTRIISLRYIDMATSSRPRPTRKRHTFFE